MAIRPAGLPPWAGTVNEGTPRETLCPSVLRRLLGGLGCGRRAAVVGLGVAGPLLAAGHHQRRLAFQHPAVPDRADRIDDDPLLGGLDLLHGDPRLEGVADLHRRLAAQVRSAEHTSELKSHMRLSAAVFVLKKK